MPSLLYAAVACMILLPLALLDFASTSQKPHFLRKPGPNQHGFRIIGHIRASRIASSQVFTNMATTLAELLTLPDTPARVSKGSRSALVRPEVLRRLADKHANATNASRERHGGATDEAHANATIELTHANTSKESRGHSGGDTEEAHANTTSETRDHNGDDTHQDTKKAGMTPDKLHWVIIGTLVGFAIVASLAWCICFAKADPPLGKADTE